MNAPVIYAVKVEYDKVFYHPDGSDLHEFAKVSITYVVDAVQAAVTGFVPTAS